jgi:uncharacterized protein
MGAYHLSGKYVLITGASSGIGKALSRRFAAEGAHCVLGALPSEADALRKWSAELHSRYGVKTRAIPVDLSEPDGPLRLYEAANANIPHLDILVNNAGIMVYGLFHEIPIERMDRLMQVNNRAYLWLMRLVLPDMIKRGEGRILNVSSVSAFQPTAYHAAYGASKSFVQNLSEAVRQDLRGTGIVVCTLNPSYTDTPMLHAADFPKKLRWYAVSGLSDPDIIAEKGVRALIKGKPVYVPGLKNRLLHSLVPRLFPRRLAGYISYQALKKLP